jgi:hypothetical protein
MGWYERTIKNTLVNISGHVVELGSGAGFFKQLYSQCITSDVFQCEGIDMYGPIL